MANSDLIERLVGGHRASVVAVVATHCAHCKAVAPHLAALASTYGPDVHYVSVLADDTPDVVEALNVRSTPTILAYTATTELARHVGGGSLADLDRIFASARDGESLRRQSVSSSDRLIRGGVAAVLSVAGVVTTTWWLLVVGLLFAVGGFYDMLFQKRARKGRNKEDLTAFDPSTAATMIAKAEVVVIDVRTAREVARGMIEGAIHLDLASSDFQEKVAALDDSSDYLLYCGTGRRSAQALRTFHASGHPSAAHLAGGTEAWKASGMALIRSSESGSR